MIPIIFMFVLYLLQSVKGNDCDKLGIVIYEDLGCKPVTVEGKSCPIKYDCDLELRNNTCLFRNLKISIGQDIPDDLIHGKCENNCRCTTQRASPEAIEKSIKGEPYVLGEFLCTELDCPEFSKQKNIEKNCYRQYSLDKCCGEGILCDTPEKPLTRCKVTPEETVIQGQTFWPSNSCLTCVCPKNYNGKFEEPHCRRNKCDAQIYAQREIINHCAPFYKFSDNEPLCCPTAWICPKETDKIVTVNSNADQTSELSCKFGTKSLKLGEGLETTATTTWNQKVFKSKCECILPPFLTCREIKN